MVPKKQVTADRERASTNKAARSIILGLVLLGPAGLCCLSGLVVPTIRTVVSSLQETSPIQEPQFIGLENYTRLFQDAMFADALGFTLLMAVVRMLIVALVPLLLALAVNEFGRVVRIPVRLLFTVPLALFSPVATALIWTMVLHPDAGLANAILQGLGLAPQYWLADPDRVRTAFFLVDGLATFGLACGVGLIFYLTALRGSGEAAPSWKEAAVPLAASWLTGLFVTVALTLQSFTMSYALTQGGPANTTMTLGLYQYKTAFQFFRFGFGAAVAILILVVVGLLGLVVGLIVVLAELRLEVVSWGKQSGLLSGVGKPSWRRVVAVVVLAVALLCSLGVCLPSALPLPWTALNSLKSEAETLAMPPSFFPSSPSLDAYRRLGESIPIAGVMVNTILPSLALVLAQIPIVYLGALGIGAVRPFGRRSEWLLLLFSPWLFVTLGPLSIVAFESRHSAGLLNTTVGLISPIVLSVPALFILTLFFKGQEPKWRTALAEGQPPMRTLFTTLVLPSLPLTLLLACASFLVGLQDVTWPLIAAGQLEDLTAGAALLSLRHMFALSWPLLSAGLVLFGVPAFLFFFMVFGLFQALYLDRVALVGRVIGHKELDLQHIVEEESRSE